MQEVYDREAHIKSLEKIPELDCVSAFSGKKDHWRITLNAVGVGRYDLYIYTLGSFPEASPILRIMSGLCHQRADPRTGEITFPYLQERWDGKKLIGDIVERVIKELTQEPPTLPMKQEKEIQTLDIESLEEWKEKDEIIQDLHKQLATANRNIKKRAEAEIKHLEEFREMIHKKKRLQLLLEEALSSSHTPTGGVGDGVSTNEGAFEEIRRTMKQLNEELKEQLNAANKKMDKLTASISQMTTDRNKLSQSLDKMLQQVSQDTKDINPRIAREITDEIDRAIFNNIVKKVNMYFFDCKVVRSDYVETKVVFKSTVANIIKNTIAISKELTSNIPLFSIITSIANAVAQTCGQWYIEKLFENVLNFEDRIGTESVNLFAKLFGLYLLHHEKFQTGKRQVIKPNDNSAYIKLSDTYCERLFAVLTTDALCQLWDEKNKELSSGVLDSLIIEIMDILAIGENEKQFEEKINNFNKKKFKELSNKSEEDKMENQLKQEEKEVEDKGKKEKEKLIKDGWMKKETGILWEERYYRFFNNGIMESEHPRTKIRKRINLTNIKSIETPSDTRLYIKTSERIWKFECLDAQETKEWVDVITGRSKQSLDLKTLSTPVKE